MNNLGFGHSLGVRVLVQAVWDDVGDPPDERGSPLRQSPRAKGHCCESECGKYERLTAEGETVGNSQNRLKKFHGSVGEL